MTHEVNQSIKVRTTVALAITLCSIMGSVHADSKKMLAPPPLELYTQECNSCHMAYPSTLLPAASWRRVMAGLEQHYGSDASVDAPTATAIGAWLQRHSGQGKRGGQEPPQDRITRSSWFERKHREIDATTFKRASIKSAANCTACHSGAAQGDFDEDRVRIPK